MSDPLIRLSLKNGKVLVVGGGSDDSRIIPELYGITTEEWTVAGTMNVRRSFLTVCVLLNGKVLAIGGTDHFSLSPKSCELYDPGTGVWTMFGDMNYARDSHTASILPDGKVLRKH